MPNFSQPLSTNIWVRAPEFCSQSDNKYQLDAVTKVAPALIVNGVP
jgi:hypothetical protein